MTDEAGMSEDAIPRWLWLPIVGSVVLTCALVGITGTSDSCNPLTAIPHLVGIAFAIVARKRLSLGLIVLAGSAFMAAISQIAGAASNRQGDWKFDNTVGSMMFGAMNYGVVAVVGFAISLLSDRYERTSAKHL